MRVLVVCFYFIFNNFLVLANDVESKKEVLEKLFALESKEISLETLKSDYMKNLPKRLALKIDSIAKKFRKDEAKLKEIFSEEYYKEKLIQKKKLDDKKLNLYEKNMSIDELKQIQSFELHPFVKKVYFNFTDASLDTDDYKILLGQKALYNSFGFSFLKEAVTHFFEQAEKKFQFDLEKLQPFKKAVFESMESNLYKNILQNYIDTTDQDFAKFQLPTAPDPLTEEKKILAKTLVENELKYLDNPEVYRFNRLIAMAIFMGKKNFKGHNAEFSNLLVFMKDYFMNISKPKIVDFYRDSFVKIMSLTLPATFSYDELLQMQRFNESTIGQKFRKLGENLHNDTKNELIENIKKGNAPFQIALVNSLKIAQKEGLDATIIDSELKSIEAEFKKLSID